MLNSDKKFTLNYNFEKSIEFLILPLILTLAFYIRLYNLHLMPLTLDENVFVSNAIELIKDGRVEKFLKVPITMNGGHEALSYAVFSLLAQRFFIDPILVARLPAVVFGTLTVYLTYLLAKKIYDCKVGAVSSLFLAVLPWHVVMSRVGQTIVYVPFFGTLIFYLLYKGFETKRPVLILLSSCALCIGSLYTYQVAIFFIPIFIIYFAFLRKRRGWPQRDTVLAAVFLFLLLALPLFAISSKVNLFNHRYGYHIFLKGKDVLAQGFYLDLFKNLIFTLQSNFKLLFFHHFFLGPINLFAPSIRHPLLLSKFIFPLFLLSFIYACFKRSDGDVLMLLWLILSTLLLSLTVEYVMARFLFIILPVPIVLIARFLVRIMDYPVNKKCLILKITALITSLSIFVYSLLILASYHISSPYDKVEWKINSFGCRDAAYYLYKDNASKKYDVFVDFRMVISPYLRYFIDYYKDKEKKEIFVKVKHFKEIPVMQCIEEEKLRNLEKNTLAQNKVIYYILWSPETHTHDKMYKEFFSVFRKMHPLEKAAKKICYPDGSVAIEIFKISP